MKAKVTKAFNGQLETETSVRDFKVGEMIEGNLAYQAVKAEFAEWVQAPSDAEVSILSQQPKPAYQIQPVGSIRTADVGQIKQPEQQPEKAPLGVPFNKRG